MAPDYMLEDGLLVPQVSFWTGELETSGQFGGQGKGLGYGKSAWIGIILNALANLPTN